MPRRSRVLAGFGDTALALPVVLGRAVLGGVVLGAGGLGAAVPVVAHAQEEAGERRGVRLADAPASNAQRALRDFIAADGYALWVRDTVVERGDTVPSAVLLLEGTARIGGRVEGDVFVVDGDLFLRGGASVAGDVFVLGGGLYDSDLAVVEGTITYRPNEPLRVRPTGGGFEIISETEPSAAFELDGLYGLHLPSYDRVNGVSLPAGARTRRSVGAGFAEIAGGLTWIPARGDADFRLRGWWPLDSRVRVGAFAKSAVSSQETWIRPAWYNGLAHIVAGGDLRNHYDSRHFGIDLELASREPASWDEAARWRLVVSAGHEEAASLAARDVAVLFGGGEEPRPLEPNPPIDQGSYWILSSAFEWSVTGRERRVAFGLGVEGGFGAEWETEAAPASHYLLAEGRLAARRVIRWGHRVEAFALGRFDLAGHLPRQRYSAVGGAGTVPTLMARGLRGPSLVYAEGSYAVPIRGDAALGGLDVFVRGSTARAGAAESGPGWHAAVQGGFALRLWEFRFEAGAAAGSTGPAAVGAPGDGGAGVVAFVDVRTGRTARPTWMPAGRF